ncbi:MAG: hypothetical protein Q7S03_03665 [bacterium]|nr:hypothetical protein [bacterium]
MYSRSVSEEEIKEKFKGMRIGRVERESVETKEYGTENTILFLLQKI